MDWSEILAIDPKMPPVVTTRSPTFSAVEELLHLLLPPLHRQQDHEVEDAEDQGERNELDHGLTA